MVRVDLKGIHRWKKRLADGSRVEYHSIRGVKASVFWKSTGPVKIGSPEYLEAYKQAARPPADEEKFGSVIDAYFDSVLPYGVFGYDLTPSGKASLDRSLRALGGRLTVRAYHIGRAVGGSLVKQAVIQDRLEGHLSSRECLACLFPLIGRNDSCEAVQRGCSGAAFGKLLACLAVIPRDSEESPAVRGGGSALPVRLTLYVDTVDRVPG